MQRRKDQESKTAQRTRHALTDNPAELAGWMPTDSGTGRLATGGKALESSPGKARALSAAANIRKNYSHSWTYLNARRTNTKSSLLDINIPEPNQTIFSKILPFKQSIYEDKFNGNNNNNQVPCFKIDNRLQSKRRNDLKRAATSAYALNTRISKEQLETYKQKN